MNEIKVNEHQETDEYMKNAYPRRKLFSSIPVGEVTDKNDMRAVKAHAKIGVIKPSKK